MMKKRYRLPRRNDWVRVEIIFRLILNFLLGCFHCWQWLRFQGCVVAATGADQQTSTTRRTGLQLYGPIGSVMLSIRRDIGDGVLASNVTGYLLAHRDDIPY